MRNFVYSLRSKRFRGVWGQRTGFLVFARAENGEREPKMKYGGGGGEGRKRLDFENSVRKRTELVIGWAS